MKRLLIIALCLFVFALPSLAGDIPIPPKCATCSTAQPAPSPTTAAITTVPGDIPIGSQIALLLIKFFV
jgi:hypothetical protein